MEILKQQKFDLSIENKMQVLTTSEFKEYLSDLLKDCNAFEKYLDNTLDSLDEKKRIEIIHHLRQNIIKRLRHQINVINTHENQNRNNYSQGIEAELHNIDSSEFEIRINPLLLWRKAQ